MKILEVILNPYGTDAILQGTDWTKDWLDWVNMVPLLQAQLPPDRISKEQPTVEQVKAKIDAWRRANPDKFPEAAWKELGGKGPAPTPNEKIKGRDLRLQPPDDSGTWIDSGTTWIHTIPPFIRAIKPDPTNKHTWGQPGGDKSYIPIANQISKFRPDLETAIKNDKEFQAKLTVDTKNMSASDAKHYRQEMTDQRLNQQIEAKLREIPGNGPGGKMYSNREINDGMREELGVFNFDRVYHTHRATEEEKAKKAAEKAEQQAYKDAQKWYKKHNNTCPDGWIRDDAKKACVRDPNTVPEPDQDHNCPPGWKYDETNDVCVKDGTTPVTPVPVPVPVTPPANDPAIPVNGQCGAGYKLSADKTKCEPISPDPVNGKVNMIFPVGNINTPRTTDFGGNGGEHEGIDIADQLQTIKYGTAVVAPEDGKIVYFNTQAGEPGQNGYGLNIKFLSNDRKREHVFAHLSQAFPEDESFKQGEKIAEVGGVGRAYKKLDKDGKKITVSAKNDPRPGHSSGVHLHWGIKENGIFVDPLKYFK